MYDVRNGSIYMSQFTDISRREYRSGLLGETQLTSSPLELFKRWFKEALEKQATDAYSMLLSTAGKKGIPSARIVLLRSFDEKGFIFFTNYNSSKATEIAENPNVCLNFYWHSPDRQVIIKGKAIKTSDDISDAYFTTRPRNSQLGAWASDQSHVIENRAVLDKNVEHYRKKFKGKKVLRPPHWGGFIIKPLEIEFWQGRENRLHDRFRYLLQKDGTWKVERLAP